MKSFREFIVLLLSFFCSIMAHAQKEYNGVMTRYLLPLHPIIEIVPFS